MKQDKLRSLPTKPLSTSNVDIILNIPTIIICPICFTDYQTSEVISGCSKKHYFCKACFTQYLKHLISESQVIKIVCPQDGCMETIEVKYIEQLVSAPLFEKYKTLLQNLQDKTQIKCPKFYCQKRIKMATKKEFSLCECGTKVCNKCWNYWHKDKTCLQNINEELGEYSKKNLTKLCMNCKTIVTKMEGCPHMNCPICKYDWCWDCGGKYFPGHLQNCTKIWSPTNKFARQGLREKFRRIEPKFIFLCRIIAAASIPLIVVVAIGLMLFP